MFSRLQSKHILASVLVGIILSLVAGCSCSPNQKKAATKASGPKKAKTIEEMEERRRKREAEQEEQLDFEIIDLRVMPSDEPVQGKRRPESHVKPGHWFAAIQQVRANKFDFPKAEIEANCIDRNLNPVKLPGGDFELITRRNVSLPKGQQKNADLLLFSPTPPRDPETAQYGSAKSMYMMSRLQPRGGGRQLDDPKSELATPMKGHENHLVVLADRADNYQFLKGLPSVRPPQEEFIRPSVDYHIKLPKGKQRIDLSPHPLTWTTVSYVVWDDFDPDILTLGQQQAMLDWLHWGGQLIVNGPKTLDRLSSSFLGEYLPARAGKTSKITDEQLAELNEHWSFEDGGVELPEPQVDPETGKLDRQPRTFDIELTEESDRPLAIELRLIGSGQLVDSSGELVAESYVGRGSIRVSAFNLPHPVFRRWVGYDGFFNACCLGRLPRVFSGSQTSQVTDDWAGGVIRRDDPRGTSTVRYFSRDAERLSNRRKNRQAALPVFRPGAVADEDSEAELKFAHPLSRRGVGTYGVTGFRDDGILGVAAWSDDGDVSRAATNALQVASGIEVPPANFVVKILGLYLVILIPVNWILFRLIGRVEWAWAMIPVLSIGGAIGVLRATNLDIGFVRSRTEVGVIELQPGYDRAHMTRFIGFYTSLAAPYEIKGEDPSTLLLPITNANEQRTSRTVTLHVGDEVKMTGFNVGASSTGFIHSEQMLNIGGNIELTDKGLSNSSNLNLQGVLVVRRISETTIEVAKVGELASGMKVSTLEFAKLETQDIEFKDWEDNASTSRNATDAELNIRSILDLASAPDRLGMDECVLVGWTNKVVPGLSVKPVAAQVTAKSVVIAQLQHARRPKPQRDTNCFFVENELSKKVLRNF